MNTKNGSFTYTTQAQVRKAFLEQFPNLDYRKIKDFTGKGKMFKADVRMTFCNFIDDLHRNGDISDKLADQATL